MHCILHSSEDAATEAPRQQDINLCASNLMSKIKLIFPEIDVPVEEPIFSDKKIGWIMANCANETIIHRVIGTKAYLLVLPFLFLYRIHVVMDLIRQGIHLYQTPSVADCWLSLNRRVIHSITIMMDK